jgi:PhzF family phenazine biosynthesis protein
MAEFANEMEVRGWHPDHAAIGALARASDTLGLCVFARSAADPQALVVRAFPAGVGIVEDPASGAANGLIGAYLGLAASAEDPLRRGYVVSQGREIGHDATLRLRYADDGAVWVGGRTHTVIRGAVRWGR